MTTPPDAWQAFGRQLHQDFPTLYPDVFIGMREVFACMPKKQRVELLEFLRYLASDAVTPPERMRLWLSSGAQFFVPQGELQGFVRALHDDLEAAGPAVSGVIS